MAGFNRYLDWYTHLGYYLILRLDRPVYDPTMPAWFLPFLHFGTNSPGATLGAYVKALLPSDRGGRA
jgi:hypothetical protein